MKTENKQHYFFELYSNYNFKDLKPADKEFVEQYFSEEEYVQLRNLHLSLESKDDEQYDIHLFKDDILNKVIPNDEEIIPVFKRSIPFYKVAMMLILALSTGLFFGQFIGKPTHEQHIQLAYQDSTHNPTKETIIYKCPDHNIISDNMGNTNNLVENEIKTVSTCEMKQILKEQPKKVDNQIIEDFPLVSF